MVWADKMPGKNKKFECSVCGEEHPKYIYSLNGFACEIKSVTSQEQNDFLGMGIVTIIKVY